MFWFVMAMIIPLWVFVYTIQFGRWLRKKQNTQGSISAFTIAGVSLVVSGVVLWRVFF